MIKSIEKSAKTEEMAIAAALEELGLTRVSLTSGTASQLIIYTS